MRSGRRRKESAVVTAASAPYDIATRDPETPPASGSLNRGGSIDGRLLPGGRRDFWRVRALVARNLFPRVGAVVDVLLEPLHLDLQLEQAMAQLGPAMTLTRR